MLKVGAMRNAFFSARGYGVLKKFDLQFPYQFHNFNNKMKMPYTIVMMKMPVAVLSRCVLMYTVKKATLASKHKLPSDVMRLFSVTKNRRKSPNETDGNLRQYKITSPSSGAIKPITRPSGRLSLVRKNVPVFFKVSF